MSTYYKKLAYVLLHVCYQEFMHDKYSSCVNRIKHEAFNLLPRCQSPWLFIEEKLVGMCHSNVAGVRPGGNPSKPGNDYLSTPCNDRLQRGSGTGKYRLGNSLDRMPVLHFREFLVPG